MNYFLSLSKIMPIMKRTCLLLVLLSLFAGACHEKSKPERVAERFLSAYLDCRYEDAERLASAEVMEGMRWRLSQLTQAEVELLADNEPQVEAEDMEVCGDSCIVSLRAEDVLLLDSIGQPARIGERRYRLVVQKEKGRNWKVTALIPNL